MTGFNVKPFQKAHIVDTVLAYGREESLYPASEYDQSFEFELEKIDHNLDSGTFRDRLEDLEGEGVIDEEDEVYIIYVDKVDEEYGDLPILSDL